MAAEGDGDYIAYVTGRLPVLRRVAAQLTGDVHRGDDLVQHAITRLYVHWRRASRTDNLDAYVYRILLRAFLDERRVRWAGVRLGASGDDEPRDVSADHAGGVADRLLLREALASLPPRQRAVLVLRFLVDLSVEDVSGILNISTGTVKSQTHDGLKTLRRLLDDADASREAMS